MKTTNDGGPAFPLMGESNHPDGGRYLFNQGMTLRDYFAGQALAGILANPLEDYSGTTRVYKANESYRQADAMLAAREGKQ